MGSGWLLCRGIRRGRADKGLRATPCENPGGEWPQTKLARSQQAPFGANGLLFGLWCLFAFEPGFAGRAADHVAQFIQFDEVVSLAAQLIRNHRRLAADG